MGWGIWLIPIHDHFEKDSSKAKILLGYFNTLLGLALAVMPWLINDSNTALVIISSLAGLFIMALSFPKGKIEEKYGLWNKYVV